MIRPNLFDFATSELSQDAFICWLLSWANPELESLDKDLHHCGLEMIAALFRSSSIKQPVKIETIKIHRQFNNIDVLCIVNQKIVDKVIIEQGYAILIEDKTGTKNHSNQLEKYYKQVLALGFSEENIAAIYYKTEDQSCYLDVKKHKFMPFLRGDILSVLNIYKGTNPILVDYSDRLQKTSHETESYLAKPPSEWSWRAWKGFYMRLQRELGYGDWGYVPNQSGGFLGFWWNFKRDSDCHQHLQLEGRPLPEENRFKNLLHLKVKVEESAKRSKLRQHWYKCFTQEAEMLGLNFNRPSRFGSGKHMTASTYTDYIQIADDRVDIKETIAVLKKAEEVLTNTRLKN